MPMKIPEKPVGERQDHTHCQVSWLSYCSSLYPFLIVVVSTLLQVEVLGGAIHRTKDLQDMLCLVVLVLFPELHPRQENKYTFSLPLRLYRQHTHTYRWQVWLRDSDSFWLQPWYWGQFGLIIVSFVSLLTRYLHLSPDKFVFVPFIPLERHIFILFDLFV